MRTAPLLALGLAAVSIESIPAAAQRQVGRLVRRAFDYGAIEVGMVGGPNRSTVTGAGPVDAKIRGSLGGFVSVRLGEGFRLRPELLVTAKAVASRAEITPPCLPTGPCPAPFTQTETTSITWLEAPILLEYRFGGFGRGRLAPKLFAGPFLAIRMGCSVSTEAESSADRVVRSCTEQPGGTWYHNGDAGFVAGAGLTTGAVGFGLRWSRSLVELAPHQATGTSRLMGAKQSSLTVTVEFATRIW